MSIIPTGWVWELTRSLFPHVSPVLLWLLFITLVPEDLKIKASKSQMLIPKVSLWNTYLRLPMLNFATGGPFVEIVVIISIQPPWCQNSAKFHSSSFSTLTKIPSFRQKKTHFKRSKLSHGVFRKFTVSSQKVLQKTPDVSCELKQIRTWGTDTLSFGEILCRFHLSTSVKLFHPGMATDGLEDHFSETLGSVFGFFHNPYHRLHPRTPTR